ncbi:MAG: lysylphosphatidylglycerol synthase domain-containing protein [Acidobacteriota bacterium]
MSDQISSRNINRLKIAGLILTVGGIALFAYLVYAVGVGELVDGIVRFGVVGFAVILVMFFLRILVRAAAWSMSVYEPYYLRLRDTIPAVIIGEATSSIIPLGILISGTAKAVAVRHRVPLVVGMSSVATENLFYSLVTSIFLIAGAVTFLRLTPLEEGWVVTINVIIVGIVLLLIFMFLMVVRQWHFASEACEKLYQRGFAKRWLEKGRMDVRLFENLIYGYYRRYPRRFLPICGFEAIYHLIGVLEVYYVLSRISEGVPSLMTSFLLESVSRLVSILFKLIPMTIGVDEAGAKFVGDAFALAAGVGVTLAIIRKGRILFWTTIGMAMIVKRGLTFRQITAPEKD